MKAFVCLACAYSETEENPEVVIPRMYWFCP